MRRKRCHRPEQHKPRNAIDDDFLVAEAKMPASVIGRLGENQHDEMVEEMADIQIDI